MSKKITKKPSKAKKNALTRLTPLVPLAERVNKIVNVNTPKATRPTKYGKVPSKDQMYMVLVPETDHNDKPKANGRWYYYFYNDIDLVRSMVKENDGSKVYMYPQNTLVESIEANYRLEVA